MSEENESSRDLSRDNLSIQQAQQDSQQVVQSSDNISSLQMQQNTQQSVQPQTPQTNYIGKVIISDRDRAKHNEFYVWVAKDENIEVGSTILVAEDDKNKIVGLVVDSYSTSSAENALAEFYSSEVGNPSVQLPIEPRVITVYKVRVLRREPAITKPPTSRMRVRFADQQDIDFLNQTISPRNRVLAGFLYSFSDPQNPNSWIPLYYDARYIAGPEGAHVMITGKSGLAAKTTYALFLIFSFLQWARNNNRRVAVVAFNVKQCDLFRIGNILQMRSWDQVEDAIKRYFGNRPELASMNIGLWRRLKQEFNLNSPSDLIPADANGPQLYFWTYGLTDRCIQGITPQPGIYSYGIGDLSREELEEVLSGGDYDILTDPQQQYVTALASYIEDQIQNQRNQNITFTQLLNDAGDVIQGQRRGIFFRVPGAGNTYKESTIMVVARRVKNFLQGNRDFGLMMNQQRGNPITGTNIHEGIHIIQLNFPSEVMQRLIFNNVLNQLLQIQQSNTFDHILVFVDELNKFAPKKSNSPIKESIIDIAARARSLNIGLVGAQQFASLIDEQVYGNASTYIIGNTDDAELKNDEYRKFGDLKTLIPELAQGDVVVYQLASYNSPIKVRFPIMLHELQ
ncbi:MAG: ATP-binding protein [Sulfolobus sp.]